MNRIWRLGFAAALALVARAAFAGPVPPVGCPTCIQNTATPQTAQINIGTATIRGTLTASTIAVTNLSVTTMTAAQFSGGGAAINSLNASNLASGTVPAARLSGSYTGLTGLGALTTGSLASGFTPVGTSLGGTGQNWVTVSSGSLPFFSGVGAMSTLSPGTANMVLQTNGQGFAPSWTNAPTIAGTNISALPLANLASGTLPTSIGVADGSLSSVSGSKISGNISGNAANITGTLPLAQLGAGTLSTSNPASSVTASGVSPLTCGSATYSCQAAIHSDGRVYSATQIPITVGASSVTAGTFPTGLTLPLADLATGTLSTANPASSVTATGVAPGYCGGSTTSCQLNLGADGRVYGATQYSIPGVSTRTAYIDLDNIWHGGPQTSLSTWTFVNGARVNNGLALGTPLATSYGGFGQNLGTIGPGWMPYFSAPGVFSMLPPGTTGYTLIMSGGVPIWAPSASSATALSGGAPGSLPYQSATNVTAFLPASVNGYALQQAAGVPGWVAAVSSATNIAGGALGAVPYQSAANTTALLAAGTGVLQDAGGAPAWSAAPTLTGTNFSGVPLAALNSGGLSTGITVSTANVVPGFNGASELLQMSGAGAYPAASGAAITSLTGANVTGSVPNASAVPSTGVSAGPLNTNVTVSTANILPGFNGASELTQLNASGQLPALDAHLLTGLTGANVGGTVPSASTTTSLAAGGAGQIPYQSAANVTAFLPSMGATGIIVGNGVGVVPSTATLSGTASQVSVTQTATAVTLSLPATINVNTSGNAGTATALASAPTQCSAGNYPLGIAANGNAQSCTAVGTGTVTTIGTPTVGKVAMFSGSTAISTASFYDSGAGGITIPATSSVTNSGSETMVAGSTLAVNGYSSVTNFLSSATVTAATSISFGLKPPPVTVSSPTVDCTIDGIWNTTAGTGSLTFNGDTTSGHYGTYGYWQGAGGGAGYSGAGTTAISPYANNVGTTQPFSFTIHYLVPATGSTLMVTGNGAIVDTGPNQDSNFYGAKWSGGTYPSYGTFTAVSGTITASARCTYIGF